MLFQDYNVYFYLSKMNERKRHLLVRKRKQYFSALKRDTKINTRLRFYSNLKN